MGEKCCKYFRVCLLLSFFFRNMAQEGTDRGLVLLSKKRRVFIGIKYRIMKEEKIIMTQKDLEQFRKDADNLDLPMPEDLPYRLEVLKTRIQEHLNNETIPDEEEVELMLSDYEYLGKYLGKDQEEVLEVVSWLRSFTEEYQ